MILLILINIVIIVYIYLKYYKSPKTINEDIKNENSMVIGYINDKGFNNSFDLIVAQIIELNIKGYIKIKYSNDSIDKYNYTIIQNVDIKIDKISQYEIVMLNYLFSSKAEITKNELEQKLNNTFYSYNTQFNEIEKVLNKQLLKENVINEDKQKDLAKKRKNYIKISIILILLVSILGISQILKITSLYMLIYILEKVVSIVLLGKANIYTEKGQILKHSIDNYKLELKNKEFFTSKTSMEEIVLNKEFANSIALHIHTQAKTAFIDDKTFKKATRISKKTFINILIAFIIIVLVGIIMLKITLLLPIEWRFWLYLIIAISGACVADITLYKKK